MPSKARPRAQAEEVEKYSAKISIRNGFFVTSFEKCPIIQIEQFPSEGSMVKACQDLECSLFFIEEIFAF